MIWNTGLGFQDDFEIIYGLSKSKHYNLVMKITLSCRGKRHRKPDNFFNGCLGIFSLGHVIGQKSTKILYSSVYFVASNGGFCQFYPWRDEYCGQMGQFAIRLHDVGVFGIHKLICDEIWISNNASLKPFNFN